MAFARYRTGLDVLFLWNWPPSWKMRVTLSAYFSQLNRRRSTDRWGAGKFAGLNGTRTAPTRFYIKKIPLSFRFAWTEREQKYLFFKMTAKLKYKRTWWETTTQRRPPSPAPRYSHWSLPLRVPVPYSPFSTTSEMNSSKSWLSSSWNRNVR